MQRYLAVLVLFVGVIYSASWNYDNKGPDQWGTLNEEWKKCQVGENQSPIDIHTKDAIKEKRDLEFSYSAPSESIINDGHTLQVRFNQGNFVKWMGETYQLVQFHFHTPSENKIDGKGFPLEVHFVHQNQKGQMLVLSALFEEGKPNADLQTIIDILPLEKQEAKELGVKINPFEQLAFYSFKGSLTTPPCSEDVQWIVMKQALQASKEQIATFHKTLGNNARTTQNLGHRNVYETQ